MQVLVSAAGASMPYQILDNQATRHGQVTRGGRAEHQRGLLVRSILSCALFIGEWATHRLTSTEKIGVATTFIPIPLWHSRPTPASSDGISSLHRTTHTIGTRCRSRCWLTQFSTTRNAGCSPGPIETDFTICWTDRPENSCLELHMSGKLGQTDLMRRVAHASVQNRCRVGKARPYILVSLAGPIGGPLAMIRSLSLSLFLLLTEAVSFMFCLTDRRRKNDSFWEACT